MRNEDKLSINSPSISEDIRRTYDLAQNYRRCEEFGAATNAYQKVIELVDSLEDNPLEELTNEMKSYKEKAKASISLIRDINAFVNVDLMNP